MKISFYRVSTGVFALLIAALLPACKSVDAPKVPGVTPYRMVIQQGNFISQEMVSQLKIGMTKEQVRFVLGTPLVTDIFHADRWDYVFFRELPDGKREQRNLSVVFENSKLARVLGDLLPSEGAAQTSGFEAQVKPDVRPKPAAIPDAKPALEAPKAAAVPPMPAPEPIMPAQSGQSGGTAEPEKKVEAAPDPKTEQNKTTEDKKPSLFDRLREKIGL